MRVLVTAASKHGATEDIAKAIAAGLAESGIPVDVRPPDTVTSLADYDAVVLGSAVYAGHWLDQARAFVAHHRDDLAHKPLWLFSSGPLGGPLAKIPDPAEAALFVEELGARGHRTFSGRLEKDDLSFAERAVAKVVRAPLGDFRPWPDIAAWANEIALDLQPVVTA